MIKLKIKPIKSVIEKKRKELKKNEKKVKPKKEKDEFKYNKTNSLKQNIFCEAWVESIGNGTTAALVAFDIKGKEILDKEPPSKETKIKEGKKEKVIRNPEYDEYKKEIMRVESVAATMATEYLRKPQIRKRIDELLDEREFNDEGGKREHFKLIKRADSQVKVRAIDMYYKLKQKYSDTTVNITIEEAMKKNIEDRKNKES